MRYDSINEAIKTVNAKSYLEIGFQQGKNFEQIRCENKLAVDPRPVVRSEFCVIADSDAFFLNNTDKFDVIFIDGLHTYEQVKKDFENSIKALNEGGAICFHDTSPCDEEHAKSFAHGGQWNGDCYRIVVDLYAGVYKFKYYTINEDHGVTVVFPDQLEERSNSVESGYKWFDENRIAVLKVRE